MNEIIIFENEQKNQNIIYLEEGEIVENYIEDVSKKRLEGNINILSYSQKDIDKKNEGLLSKIFK